MASVRLKSMVLAGGSSTRMGADKTRLVYGGEPALSRVARFLSQLTTEVCVSVAKGQTPESVPGGCTLLPDAEENMGPLAGLLSAFRYDPASAWLVAAVDMPCITLETLRRLVASRDTRCQATAYRNPRTGMPEPVLAVYEPTILPALRKARDTGRYSLMLLMDLPHRLVEAADPAELTNINDPEDYRRYQEGGNGNR